MTITKNSARFAAVLLAMLMLLTTLMPATKVAAAVTFPVSIDSTYSSKESLGSLVKTSPVAIQAMTDNKSITVDSIVSAIITKFSGQQCASQSEFDTMLGVAIIYLTTEDPVDPPDPTTPTLPTSFDFSGKDTEVVMSIIAGWGNVNIPGLAEYNALSLEQRKKVASRLKGSNYSYESFSSNLISYVLAVQDSKDSGKPNVILTNGIYDAQTAGLKYSFPMRLQNVSSARIETMIVKLVPPTDGSILVNSSPTETFYSVSGGSSISLSPILTIPTSTKTGRYALGVEVVSIAKDGSETSNTLTQYIDVVNNNPLTGLMIESYTLSQNPVGGNTNFTLSVTVKNFTKKKVSGAKLSIDNLDGVNFAMQTGLVQYQLCDVEANGTVTLKFPLKTGASVATGTSQLNLKLSYDTAGKTEEATAQAFIPVDAGSAGVAPNIIIQNYTYGGDVVMGGTVFPLALDILNTSADVGIRNLKITISGTTNDQGAGSVFTPANSSNTFFIERLAARETKQITIDLLPKADAAPDSYGISVVFEYDYEGNASKSPAQATEKLSVPLQQEDRFSVNEPELQMQGFVGQSFPISASFVNKGKSKIYNLTIDLEGNFEKTSQAYYVGNVEAGSEDYYDSSVIPMEAGTMNGEIIFSYEDANGQTREVRKSFMVDVMDSGIPAGGDFEPGIIDPGIVDPQGGGFPWWGIVLIVLAVGGGGTAAFIILRKRKLAKKAALEDEDI